MKLSKYLPMIEKEDEKVWINTTLKSYLKKNDENQTEIEHILDYFNSDARPTRISKMSYKQAVVASAKWVKALVKKGLNIVETEEDTEVTQEFDNGFKLVKLLTKDSYAREGSLMSHCLSSYDPNANVEIFSLRDSNNQPHCTLELQRDNSTVHQIKGKGNGSIHPKYIKYILKSLKEFGMEVRVSEMSNLGYVEPPIDSGEFFSFLDSKFSGVKTLTFQDKKLFYKYSNLKLKQ